MRVKTVPRHMNVQSGADVASTSKSYENPVDVFVKREPEEDDTAEIMNASESNQMFPPRRNAFSDTSMAGPSMCGCLHDRPENATSSRWTRYEPDDADVNNAEAVDLSTKDCREHADDRAARASSEPDDKFKDTFLYKIMTDPTFLERIQRGKQPRKYTCPFCKQEFQNDDQLTDHMEVKKDESNQVGCCACRKTFAQKRYLRYHQRCHSERTKFSCDICSRKYTRLDNLARHNAFHVNPDKFSCTSCEKTFARKDLLNKHQKCHDKFRFYCEECAKYMKGPLTLDNHRKLYHSDA